MGSQTQHIADITVSVCQGEGGEGEEEESRRVVILTVLGQPSDVTCSSAGACPWQPVLSTVYSPLKKRLLICTVE